MYSILRLEFLRVIISNSVRNLPSVGSDTISMHYNSSLRCQFANLMLRNIAVPFQQYSNEARAKETAIFRNHQSTASEPLRGE